MYYDSNDEKLFDFTLERKAFMDEDPVIIDFPELTEGDKYFLERMSQEVYVFYPHNDGKDFILLYYNHAEYETEGDFNYQIGSRASKTFFADKNAFKILHDIYKTGEDKTYKILYLMMKEIT